MKTKKVTCSIGLNLIVIVMGTFLTGCAAAWNAYPGPALPRNEVAILKCGGNSGLEITSVDGRPTMVRIADWTGGHRNAGANWDGSTNRDSSGVITKIELLPGPHQISFNTWIFISNGEIKKDIDVVAGKTYVATMHKSNMDRDDYTENEYVRWTVWINPKN